MLNQTKLTTNWPLFRCTLLLSQHLQHTVFLWWVLVNRHIKKSITKSVPDPSCFTIPSMAARPGFALFPFLFFNVHSFLFKLDSAMVFLCHRFLFITSMDRTERPILWPQYCVATMYSSVVDICWAPFDLIAASIRCGREAMSLWYSEVIRKSRFLWL